MLNGISRRDFLKSIVAGLAALGMGKLEKPNIIFIMADDLGYGDLECYGQKKIKTPNITKMAEEGMRFTQCYTPSPVCAPCRCALMTGLHSGHCTRRGNRTKAHKNDREAKKGLLPLAREDFTVAALLKKAGYKTGGFGKWGLGNPGTTGTPDKHGFDLFYGYLDQVHAHDYYTDHLYRNLKKEELPGNKGKKKTQYTHDLIVEENFKFIRENRNKPFFCYAPWTPPHGKYVVPDQGQYKDKDWGEKQKNYAAMITRMDRDVGRLFALLKELGIDHKTVVFFCSDNGPNKPFLSTFGSNKPFRGIKRQLYEGGIRMPMVVRWPGKIPKGRVSDFVWSFTDFMPTAAALAGIRPPKNADGKSVLKTLMGEEQAPHDFLYWEFYDPFQQAVRLKNWKGIRFGTQKPIALYDLSRDLEEKNDLAEKYPEILKKMKQIMKASHRDTPYWPLEE